MSTTPVQPTRKSFHHTPTSISLPISFSPPFCHSLGVVLSLDQSCVFVVVSLLPKLLSELEGFCESSPGCTTSTFKSPVRLCISQNSIDVTPSTRALLNDGSSAKEEGEYQRNGKGKRRRPGDVDAQPNTGDAANGNADGELARGETQENNKRQGQGSDW